jgi:hypothetical protein
LNTKKLELESKLKNFSQSNQNEEILNLKSQYNEKVNLKIKLENYITKRI